MEKRNVLDKRSVKLEKVMGKDFIPYLGGRPERESVIGHEDIVNLEIALHTSGSLEELLAAV